MKNPGSSVFCLSFFNQKAEAAAEGHERETGALGTEQEGLSTAEGTGSP